jgi:hypothetical protein
MISDLRFVDPATPSGEWQARDILLNAGTPPPVVDWVLDTVRESHDHVRALEQELYQVHMDMNQ